MSHVSRAKPPNPSKIVLPITPMLDMTFQLLFFFIVNFQPASASTEGQLEMALPSKGAPADPQRPPAPPVGEADFPSDLTVMVRTQLDGVNDGAISAISIRNAEGRESPVEGGLDGLRERLAALRADAAGGNVKVQGDGKLKVRSLMQVMDACKEAGYKNVSMTAPE